MTSGRLSQQVLQRAHQAYAAGDLDIARSELEGLLAREPDLPQARHLAAIVERRAGRLDAARAHFEVALRRAGQDPDLLNSYANLLTDLGDLGGARDSYLRALALRPGHVETLVNLGLVHRRLGATAAAHAVLTEAVRREPGHARAWQSLALVSAEADDLDAAALAYDHALALQPQSLLALRGRAHVEAERGGDAAPWYARAQAAAPQDPHLALEIALAEQKAGSTDLATRRLEALVAALPEFADAHQALSRLRWQMGDDGFVRGYDAALAVRPGDAALWLGRLGALMRAGRPEAVLADLAPARSVLGPLAIGLEAAAAAETGDLARAEAAFARTDPAADPGLRLAYLRFLLRAARPEAAAVFAGDVLDRFADRAAWPYLATAWRWLDDPRWGWLEGDPAFVRAFDLEMDATELAALAGTLRALHHARRAPLDQTLRGGTQTEGALLSRREPAIQRLRAALSGAVRRYIDGLPPADPTHPLLAPPRGGFRFAGSWSVRLVGAGFHVNHVHTTGWLSSAFYAALPDEVSDGDEAGWLAFGEPPAELGVPLAVFRTIQPKPCRLALFPSTVWHGTRPFTAGERLTVAFDVTPAESGAPRA